MPTLELALEAGAEKELRVEWNFVFSRARVTHRGVTILEFRSNGSLRDGAETTLPDGSRLSVKLVSWWLQPSIEVTRNDLPIPGSPTHPRERILTGGNALFSAAALSLIEVVRGVEGARASANLWVIPLVVGCVFAGLAFFTRRLARWALLFGVALHILDTVAWLAMLRLHVATPHFGGNFLIIRVFILMTLIRGLRAFRDLDRLDLNAVVHVFR